MSDSQAPFDLRRWLKGEPLDPGPRGRAQAALAMTMLASIGAYALLWPAPGWMPIALVAAAMVLLVGRSTAPIVAILAWVWGVRLIPESYGLFADDDLRLGDVVAAVILLMFLVFALRYLELQSPRRTARSTTGAEPAPTWRLQPFSGVVWRLAIAPVLALLFLWLTPLQEMMYNAPRLTPPGYRTIVFLWLLAFLAVLLATAFALIQWRRLSPRQGALYVRQQLIDEVRIEQIALERRRNSRLRKHSAGDETIWDS